MELSRRRVLEGLGVGCLGGLAACAVNPSTGRSAFTAFMSPDEELRVGQEEHPKLVQSLGGEYLDPDLVAYIGDIGRSVARTSEMPNLPYTFTVLNSPIVNAMALPGGHIYITRGLIAIANNEAELAGVLAHEIGHVTARHTAERYSQAMLANIGLTALGIAGSLAGIGGIADVAQFGASAYLQGFSRDQELEADTLGVRYMSRAGYDNRAMVEFLSTLRQHDIVNAHMSGRAESEVDEFNMMATHPRSAERVRHAIQSAQATPLPNPRIGRKEYLDHVNGLVFGSDSSQGVIKGNRFVHPTLRFEFTVPPGFKLINGDKNVTARHQGGTSIVFDIGRNPGNGPMATYLQSDWGGKLKFSGVETITVDGRDAATGSTRVSASGKTYDVRLVAISGPDTRVYRFTFLMPQNETARLAEDLKRTTYSLRQLTAEEASRVAPQRVMVVTVRPDDSPGRLAAGLPFGKFNEEWFRLLNDLRPGELPPAGTEVKVIGG
ncbi:MAG: M48 family metalloprotease [Alphaproteobacteria bacterium]